MREYPVKLGHMLFTMVDPHRGEEVAYNRWYERDHFYAGYDPGLVTMAVRRADGVAPEAVDARWRERGLPSLLVASPVAIATSWVPVPQRGAPMDLPVVEDPDRLRMYLFFLDVDALRKWHRFERLGRDLEASGLGRVVFASPWLPTVVGTDTYTDELW